MSSSALAVGSIYDGGGDFWVEYVKGRPNIPQSYFDTIFDYHARNGGSFDVAHDVGAGGGIHSGRLLDKFQRVIVSDPFENNIEAAKSQLQTRADRCTFNVSTLEDTIKTEPAQSVDLVFGQSMWHFTSPEEAIAAVAHQLKPGGTFAMSSAGFPVFKDARVWDLWSRMFHAIVLEQVNKRGGPYGPSRRPMRSQLSRLDSVPLPEEYFQPGALRIKTEDPLGPGRDFSREAMVPKEFENDVPPWSEVGENDIVQYVAATDEWTFQASYQKLRDIVLTFTNDLESDVQVKLWQEMKDIMGDTETEAVWPFSLVLASRRKE